MEGGHIHILVEHPLRPALGQEALDRREERIAQARDVPRGAVVADGGCHGSPLARDPAAVARDIWNGKVSVEAARRRYGLVIDDGGLNSIETARLRGQQQGERA